MVRRQRERSGFRFQPNDARLILAHMVVAFLALFLGAIAGLLQGLVRGGVVDLLPVTYYQLLTAHGVLMALVFTTFFIIGFLYSGLARTCGGLLSDFARRLGWIGFWLMTAGTVVATALILANEATVLYSFYAPLKASPFFYLGLTLVVVGSWIGAWAMFTQYRRWKKEHSGKLSPLMAFMAVTIMGLWLIATLGVAVEVLFQLIPWSFGWVEKINIALSRTLFWYFGHPLVYFWLLPAYMVWYVNIPGIIGGKIFSDALARLAFVLFLLLSTPVGFHHQLMEPGISPEWKFFQVILTFAVVVPSLMTAFSILATFENAGRARGGTGLFGWIRKLPWGDVRFVAPFVGMVLFIPAGAGGIVNASHQLNQVVHNTLWVTGHFHLTVATTVLLTFFGVSYWLIPALTGRRLTPGINRLGLIQTAIWSAGMLVMSGSMHAAGLLGAPRRTAFTVYGGHETALGWLSYQQAMAIGGALLFVGVLLMLWIVLRLAFFAPRAEGGVDYPVGEVAEGAEPTPRILERWPVWITVAFALILIAYTGPIMHMIQHAPPGSPPFQPY
ncbi:b(o/a)3-type cytochrome-c oxidase subunit 1 [Staphylospora marina]|uniref:b(o/a)3-type cytochrome-c oxidase subunit 1 n=1 Tax=Staphylospora marina TaxID=2490858 RepID=UPI000F5BF641|nr:b(o/a)3-type cytochrome-c oxidase subunit 1 [Staphylospora marina]